MFSHSSGQAASATGGSPSPTVATTIADLRRDRTIAPGGPRFDELVRAFLPLVHGCAAQLLPERAESVEKTVLAVFQSFAFRWKKLPRRTIIATWLIRTVCYTAARERKLAKLGSLTAAPSSAALYTALFKQLYRLSPRLLNAVVLRAILRESPTSAAKALRVWETQVDKWAVRGTAKLTKALYRKSNGTDAGTLLAAIAAPPVPPALEEAVLDAVRSWSPKQERSRLVRGTIASWRWMGFRRSLRRIASTFAIIVCVLFSTAMTLNWMAQRGYFAQWGMRNAARNMARENPEVVQPARPWPVSPEDEKVVSRVEPRNSAELYGLTNIWIARMNFTAEQWKKITPSQVEPVRNMFEGNGRIVLRNPNAKRSGLAGSLGIEFNWTDGAFEFAGRTFSKVGIRYRGNGTYVNSLFGPKQSFKVDLNEFTKGQKMAGIKTLNLVNAIPDFSYLRDALAERLFRDLGVPAPRTAYAYLTIDVPGSFTNQALGLYALIENIDADFAEDRFGIKQVPIFKPVTYDIFQDIGKDWSAYEKIYDLKTKADPEELQRVVDFAHLVSHANDAEFTRRLPEFLDIEEFAAFVAGHALLSSYDGFLTNGQNYYVYLDPRSKKFGFISWDQDHSWGEFGYIGTSEKREQASIWHPSVYKNLFLERVMKVEAFRNAYRGHLERALAELFTKDRLYAQIDHLAPIIRPAIAAESDFRLKRFDQSISTNWLSGPRDGHAEGPRAPVHQMKRFIENRIASVRAQLDGKSEGVRLNQRY